MNNLDHDFTPLTLLSTYCPQCGKQVISTELYYPEDANQNALYECEPMCLTCCLIKESANE